MGEDSTTTIMEDLTTTTEDSTIIMVAFTTTGDLATVAIVRVRAIDASVSTASLFVTGMGMSMVLAKGETQAGEHGATQLGGTTGDVGTSRLLRSSPTIPGRTQPV